MNNNPSSSSLNKILIGSTVAVLIISLIVIILLYTQKNNSNSSSSLSSQQVNANVTSALSGNIDLFLSKTLSNGTVQVDVSATPQYSLSIQGYQMRVNFDKTNLKLSNISYTLGKGSTGLGDDNTTLDTSNSNGSITLVGEIDSASGYALSSSKAVKLATLTFTTTQKNPSVTLDAQYKNRFYGIEAGDKIQEVNLTVK